MQMLQVCKRPLSRTIHTRAHHSNNQETNRKYDCYKVVLLLLCYLEMEWYCFIVNTFCTISIVVENSKHIILYVCVNQKSFYFSSFSQSHKKISFCIFFFFLRFSSIRVLKTIICSERGESIFLQLNDLKIIIYYCSRRCHRVDALLSF